MKRIAANTLTFSAVASAGMLLLCGCQTSKSANEMGQYPVQLVTVAPGHFHAALVQKSMYDEVSPVVHVYAPEGSEVKAHLGLIEKYNTSDVNPTTWEQKVYTGDDFFARMLEEKAGNVVVLAGNNQHKTDYIKRSVDAGLNVLADKPMAINSEGFEVLKSAFAAAEEKGVLLYDIMTERYEITNILQRELSQQHELFGDLEKGTPENPAVIKKSVHHFYKDVSGSPLIRPDWFYDVKQAGSGLVDITTHLVDLIQWECFPGVTFDYNKDIRMLSAKSWSTPVTPAQFTKSTKKEAFPDFLDQYVQDSVLKVYSNGEMNYTIKGIHARVEVVWNYQAPEGTGDTHYSIMRGSKANVIIRQEKDQNFKPTLFVEPLDRGADAEAAFRNVIDKLQNTYPGLAYKASENGWEIIIPENLKVGHEAHFAEVTKKYLGYLKEGKLPQWEVANMLAKYYTTTQALEKAQMVQ